MLVDGSIRLDLLAILPAKVVMTLTIRDEALKVEASYSCEVDRIRLLHEEEYRAPFILRLLRQPFRDRALDVGCGAGTLMNQLKGLGFEVAGVDINPENAIESGHSATRVDLNSEALPFESGCFGLVVCAEVLEHLFYPHFVLKEIRRVLKRDGYAVFGLPNEYHIFQRLLLLFGKRLDNHDFDTLGHHYFPSLSSCRNLVRSEFTIEEELHSFRPALFKFWPSVFARNVFFRAVPKVSL
jgi:2-polyprenyl-3-methyl-5-hydroxy-6-metoxy-1,4-benzoquinol methylase